MSYNDDMENVGDDTLQIVVPSMVNKKNKSGGGGSPNLRACFRCHIILNEEQFMRDGCPNCTELELECGMSRIEEHTSTQFEGLITLLNPELSWCGRFQRLVRGDFRLVAGVYAITVMGALAGEYAD